MGVDKNLFLYDLAAVAIMKNEGPYVKEWLDYHLLAGVNHFFVYDNGSPDNQSEVIQPYIDAGLVTYIDYPGKARQYEAYNAAVRDYKFLCRYMTFIDADEFVFPKGNKSILEVVDEVLTDKPKAAALAANIFSFGSNFQDTADYTKGVLERFTRREPIEHTPIIESSGLHGGCAHVSSITNPRRVHFFSNPHFAHYFKPYFAVNENGGVVKSYSNYPPSVEKIAMYHYSWKSREEYEKKVNRGTADAYHNVYKLENYTHDNRCNEVFDDSLLKFRNELKSAFRAKYGAADIVQTFADINFPNCERLLQAVTSNLLPGFNAENMKEFLNNPQNRYEYFATLVKLLSVAPQDFFDGRTETFLTCFAVSSFLKDNFVDEELGSLLEEFSLDGLFKSVSAGINPYEVHIFVREMPKILVLPYPVVNDLRSACIKLIPQLMDTYRTYNSISWREFIHLDYTLNLLKVFDGYQRK